MELRSKEASLFATMLPQQRPYRGQFQRTIGLGHGLVLDNLTLECRGTSTGAVMPPEGAWRQQERGYFALKPDENRGILKKLR
jgi:hypothetical protein